MARESYSPPSIELIGTVQSLTQDLTLQSKTGPGVDFGINTQGLVVPPGPGSVIVVKSVIP